MANYPKCPVCGATGPRGAKLPDCACDYSAINPYSRASVYAGLCRQAIAYAMGMSPAFANARYRNDPDVIYPIGLDCR